MVPYVQSINTHRHLIAGYSASLSNVIKIMDEARTASSIKNGSIEFTLLDRGIELEEVDFSYNQHENVLNKINLVIKKGELTAIVGSSGSGKSTLIDLILRFYDPSSGRILIDGVDLRELDLSSFRSTIGFVSQDTFLFNDTISANIGYGFICLREEIIEASKAAHAHEFIIQLPDKYDTLVGDRGVKLSGGQRQRMALARAIVRHPQILILDEATSALDTESERMIQDSLKKLGRNYTIIAIAHRISTIENADKIVVIESGKLVEEGTHESLLKAEGYYSKYYRLQYSNT
jgi:subfamily B ATP-binding cassette protein MsbA